MPFKDLEHDGHEDFLGKFPNRAESDKQALAFETEVNSEERKEKELAKQQEDWLNPNNPFLWNGEI